MIAIEIRAKRPTGGWIERRLGCCLFVGVGLALCSRAGLGDAPSSTNEPLARRIDLTVHAPSEARRLLYSRRSPIELRPSPRPGESENEMDGFLGEFPFHEEVGGKLPFAITRGSANSICPDRIHVDWNRNHDFTDDGDPITLETKNFPKRGATYSGHSFLPLVPGSGEGTEGETSPQLFSLTIWWTKDGKPSCRFHRSSWKEGSATVGKKELRMVFVDDDNDGVLSRHRRDSWNLAWKDEGDKTLFDPDRFIGISETKQLGKKTVAVNEIDPHGNFVRLRLAKETVAAFAHGQPRTNSIERPRSIRPIAWRPYEEARRRSVADDVPTLLVFLAKNDGLSTLLQKETLSDLEVVRQSTPYSCCRFEDGSESEVARKYRVIDPPTFLLLSPKGSELARKSGYVPPKTLASWLLKHRASPR